MAEDGEKDKSNGNERVNKGKGRSEYDRENDQNDRSGLLRSVVESARSNVTPQALASVLASGGKGGSTNGFLVNDTSIQRVKDSGGSSFGGTAPSGTALQNGNSIRSMPTQSNGTDAYRQFSSADQGRYLANHFENSLDISNTNQRSQPSNSAFVGPYETASQLDRPFHDFVRLSSSGISENMEEAWKDVHSQQYPDSVYDPAYHDAWASSIPAPVFPSFQSEVQRGEAFHDLQQRIDGEESKSESARQFDFMDTLALENNNEQNNASTVLSQVWRPPIPNERPSLTQEQYEMHLRLAEQQDSQEGQRADERIKPPDDDEHARTGVYATTPEGALKAIWDGDAEGQRASEHVRIVKEIRSTDAANVVRKIRRLLKRGSYTDDVYGLPPALKETLSQAEEPETDANRDMRAKAIARLGALYKHLEGSDGAASEDVEKIVRNW